MTSASARRLPFDQSLCKQSEKGRYMTGMGDGTDGEFGEIAPIVALHLEVEHLAKKVRKNGREEDS